MFSKLMYVSLVVQVLNLHTNSCPPLCRFHNHLICDRTQNTTLRNMVIFALRLRNIESIYDAHTLTYFFKLLLCHLLESNVCCRQASPFFSTLRSICGVLTFFIAWHVFILARFLPESQCIVVPGFWFSVQTIHVLSQIASSPMFRSIKTGEDFFGLGVAI